MAALPPRRKNPLLEQATPKRFVWHKSRWHNGGTMTSAQNSTQVAALQPSNNGLDLTAAEIGRGVQRVLRRLDAASITEMTLANGLRADILAIGGDGKITIVEIKSSLSDFRADQKWRGYLEFCDKFFFAVSRNFPAELIPAGTGLILADLYDAEIVRDAVGAPLPAQRRKAVTSSFARTAAFRLQTLTDPASARENAALVI